MDVEDRTGSESAALGEDEMCCYFQGGLLSGPLHLGEERTQAVHQGEADTGQDVEVLVIETERDVADSHSHGGEDEDRWCHIYVALLVFELQLLNFGSQPLKSGSSRTGEMSFNHYLAALQDGTEDVFDLADRGAVEGALQTCFVNVPAADLSEFFRVKQTRTIGGESAVDQGGLPGAGGYPEIACRGFCLRRSPVAASILTITAR